MWSNVIDDAFKDKSSKSENDVYQMYISQPPKFKFVFFSSDTEPDLKHCCCGIVVV